MDFGIIAAGEGSRLAGEGIALPKPLVNLNGEPMIGRLMDVMTRCGATSVSVITNEFMPEVARYIEDYGRQAGVDVRLVLKTTPSSMHSFYELSRVIDSERFILTTVDTIFREDDFRKYVGAFAADRDHDALMAVTSYIEDEKPLYVVTDDDMTVTAFEDGPTVGARYISGGIYGLRRNAFDVLERCISSGVSRMRNFQRALLSAGLNVAAMDMGKIIDVDHAGDIAVAEKFISEKRL